MGWRVKRAVLVAGGIATTSHVGCVRKLVDGDTTTYSTQPWIIAVVAAVAGADVLSGWYVRRTKKWPAYILIGAGLLVLCTTVPGLSMSRTLVDLDHVEWNRGFNRYRVRFDDLDRIDHSVQRIPIGRTIQDVHFLEFRRKDGKITKIQVEPGSDRFLQDAIPEILRRAREREVLCKETGPDPN
jgi:hypothetical protein